MRQSTTFDVVIVGSGAGGGTLAAHLARRGVQVAIVEGGPRVNTRTDFNTHAMPFDFPNRQIPTMRPGKAGFDSERSRGVGGKTMLWNAVALRFSQRDFKGRTFEGAGEDWPIGYNGHRPLLRHDRTRGRRLRQPRRPGRSARRHLPSAGSAQVQRRDPAAGGAVARRATSSTSARPRSPLPMQDPPRLPLLRQLHGRLRCRREVQLGGRPHRARREERAASPCSPTASSARSWSRTRTARPASATCTGCTSGRRGARPRGGRRLRLRAERRAAADVDVGALSRRAWRTPAGSSAGTSSRTSPAGSNACSTSLRGKAADQRRGVPRSRLPAVVHAPNKKRGYARSFGAQLNYQNQRFAGWAKAIGGFGQGLQGVGQGRPIRRSCSSRPTARCCRTRSRTSISIRERTDKFGLPQARRHVHWGANEEALFNDMVRWSLAMLEKAGAEISRCPTGRRPTTSSAAAAWAVTRARSVVNADCRTHDVPNLYVVDGSVFPSASEKEPDPHDHGARGARRRAHRRAG